MQLLRPQESHRLEFRSKNTVYTCQITRSEHQYLFFVFSGGNQCGFVSACRDLSGNRLVTIPPNLFVLLGDLLQLWVLFTNVFTEIDPPEFKDVFSANVGFVHRYIVFLKVTINVYNLKSNSFVYLLWEFLQRHHLLRLLSLTFYQHNRTQYNIFLCWGVGIVLIPSSLLSRLCD